MIVTLPPRKRPGMVRVYVSRAVVLRRNDGSTLKQLVGVNARHWFVRMYLVPQPEPPNTA